VRARPVTPARLAGELVERVLARPGWRRVGIDGAPAAAPGRLADAMVDPVRLRGRPAIRVDLADFLRPASVRLERGRTNPDAYYEDWFDLGALSREVLGPLSAGGSGRILPTFWDPRTDRATRAAYLEVPAGGVLLLAGPLLLGAGLELDLTVHAAVSPAALRRRTPAAEQWTLPAFERYEREVRPQELADVVVRADDPGHPALVLPEAPEAPG
jgi:hypothetical protein